MDIDKLRNTIKPLDVGQAYLPSEEEKAYLTFYGIDFQQSLAHVTHYFGFLPTLDLSAGKQQIACHFFENANAVRTCFVVHGYMDHSGLYGKIIHYLLHRGCSVVIIDLPGHGLSTGEPATIKSFGDYGLTLQHCLDFFHQKTVGPWQVIAQSMGGAIVMDYLLSQQYDDTGVFDKVLLLAPLVRPSGWLGVRLAHWTLKGFVSSIKRKFKANSHDADFVAFMENEDPLQAKRIPVQWVTSMLQWEKRFQQLSWSEMEVLVVQGEGDATVDWQFNLECIRKKFPQMKQFRIKEARHHLAREDDYYFERVIQAADIYFDRRKGLRD